VADLSDFCSYFLLMRLSCPVPGSPFISGEDGSVTVTGLTPGTYYARENPTENSYWDIDAEVKPVTVTAGQTAELTFVNTCYGRIEFRKTTNTGSHLGGWTFVVRDANGETVGTYTTDDNGYACTENLPLGRYTVTEQAAQDDYWVAELGFHDVTVTAGKAAVDEWHNKEQGLAWFVKKTNTGADTEGWCITIYSDEACTQAAKEIVTNQEGKAGYYLDPGTYWAKETGNQNGLFDNEYWVVDPAVQKFEVKPHESTEIVFSNTHRGKLEIFKTMEGSGSPEGWQFKITGPDGAEIEGSPFVTDRDGVIQTGNLLPGDYTVEELLPEDSIYSCQTENPITVTVKAGETAHVPFTNCTRPARIWIEKVDNTGKHLAGAVFRLEWSADNGQTWANIFYSDKQEPVKGGCSNVELADGCLTSNDKGELAWNNLYPGLRYRVTETQAPEGYTRLKGTAFDDTVTMKDLDVTIRVVNNRGFLLPKTGSASLRVVSIVGAVALAVSLVVLAANVGRKKR
ncbi:MAG: collagen binding domain-containing protein, partial [Faecousia sp.]